MTLFPTTRWAEILSARGDAGRRRQLLAQLSVEYRQPLIVFATSLGQSPSEAEDAVQAVLTRLLERDVVSRLDPARGRLRSFLRTAMRHYLADQHAGATAAKRGGRTSIVPLDDAPEPADGAASPDQLYDRAFAAQVITGTLARLEAEFSTGKRKGSFEAVRAYFAIDESAPTVVELAARHDTTESQMTSFLHRTRQRFRELLRAHVRELVADPADADAELQSLLAALGGAVPR